MTTEEVRDRVTSYLHGQAAKWSIEEIGARVEAAFDDLSQALTGLTPAQLAFKPEPQEWSVLEVMAHLTTSNGRSCRTIHSLALGKEVKRGDAAEQVEPVGEDVLALAAAGRDQVARLTRELPKEPVLITTAPHPYFGPLNCKEWLLFLRVHTLDHVQQIRALLAHPAFPRSSSS